MTLKVGDEHNLWFNVPVLVEKFYFTKIKTSNEQQRSFNGNNRCAISIVFQNI
jgi:hypothetical protein